MSLDWGTIGYIALAFTIISQLVIWWVDRNDPKTWIYRLRKSRPIRDSEQQWLDRYETQRRDFARPGVRGTAIIGSTPDPLDTRVGGPLMVPKGAKVPTNEMGQPLYPLVFIRLSDVPDTDGNVLPRTGWLQVLMDGPGAWDMETPTTQGSGFRIIHYEVGTEFQVLPVDDAVARSHLAWTDEKKNAGFVATGYSLAFDPVLDIAPNGHHRLEGLPDGFSTKAFNDGFHRLCYALDDDMPDCDVMIGGQAVFTQEDIRYYDDRAGFENLIRFSASGHIFSWGDAGEASVIVPEQDLSTGRLQNAVFHYDFH